MSVFKKIDGIPKRVAIMGIINVTPDSFSDGGRFYCAGKICGEPDLNKIISETEKMVADGADILDIGGESSGPDSKDVSLQEELRRVIPVVKVLRKRWPCRKFRERRYLDCRYRPLIEVVPQISVDTYKPEVAQQAIDAGADMINDVTAFRGGGRSNGNGDGNGDGGMVKVVAQTGVPVVLMYSKDSSARTTRKMVQYDDVIRTIKDFFEERIVFAEKNGVKRDQIILDPGMGFFVSGDPKYSFEILERLDEFQIFGCPILLGPSRKSFLRGLMPEAMVTRSMSKVPASGMFTRRPSPGSVKDRLSGTIAACQKAVLKGAQILRIHDIAANAAAISQALSYRPQKPANSLLLPEERIVELL